MLDFLHHLYSSGRGYSALNTARGALSAISGESVGSHPLVSRFMKGIFHKKPSLPRYNVTWDVSVVLEYLKTLQDGKLLTLKMLSAKLVMLIALLSAQRGQTLHLIKCADIEVTDKKLTIQLTSLLKQSRPSKHPGTITLPAYSKDKRLCVVSTMNQYLERTVSLRKGEKLFVSTIAPHKEVSRDTISRWIRFVLQKSGIDTKIFKPHSTRMAATSKATDLHVPISTVIRTAGWSTDCTFRKFYHKPIKNSNEQFALTILDNATNK